MKMLLLTLLLFPFLAFAQSKKPSPTTHRQSLGMEGLGKFKINKTTVSAIDEMCKNLHMELQHGYSINSLSDVADSVTVMEVDYESPEDYPDASRYGNGCPGVRVFYLPNYSVADMLLKGVVLTFYNGLLASIEIEKPAELLEAFTLKYGKPDTHMYTEHKTCLFTTTGNKAILKAESFTSIWHNGEIEAQSVEGEYFNKNCQKQYLTTFTIRNGKKTKIMEACGAAIERAHQASITNSRKKKLSEI